MPTHALTKVLAARLEELKRAGRLKGKESVICGFIPARGGDGPRYLVEGEGDKPFLRMNSNSYLGMSLRSEIVAAEEAAVGSYGADRARCGSSAEPGRRISRWRGRRKSSFINISTRVTLNGALKRRRRNAFARSCDRRRLQHARRSRSSRPHYSARARL